MSSTQNFLIYYYEIKNKTETSEINLFQMITFQQDTGRQLQRDVHRANHFQCECSFNYKAAA